MVQLKQVFVILAILATTINLASCSKPEPVDKTKIAIEFTQAVNQNNTDKIVKLSGTKLSIRNQKWESAPDGAGFVLGKADDTSLNSPETIKNWLNSNINKIAVEGAAPTNADLNLLKDELKGIESIWNGLDTYLFLRGMADVEHIFVVGINSKGKVVALYFN